MSKREKKQREKVENFQELMAEGVRTLNAGRWREAEGYFRRAVAREARNHTALMLLGATLSKSGRPDEAIMLLQQAVELAPGAEDVYCNLGMALHAAGRGDEARAAYEKAISLVPSFVVAHYNLGILLLEKGDLASAISHFEYVVQRDSDNIQAWFHLGDAHARGGALAEAVACYRQCVKRKPDFAEAWLALGRCLLALGEKEAALSCLEKSVAASSDDAEILFKVAGELLGRAQGELALRFLDKALALVPDEPRFLEAKAAAWSYAGNFDEAATWAERALALAPELLQARNVRAGVFYKMGDAASALSHYAIALSHQLDCDFIWSNKLLMMNYLEIPSEQQTAEHRQWGDFFIRQYQAQRPKLRNDLSNDRKLRIGYLSPDFCQHSVAYFIAPILLAHDRSAFEVYCYANVLKADKFTERIKSFDLVWRDISFWNDTGSAAKIAEDRIDILVDLAGHTSHNRLPIFALQPAPVQITYLGYPATTGLTTVAYRLTDSLADPPGLTEHLYTEQLLRLDPCFLCYNPLKDAPAVRPPPSTIRGIITFGSFNNIAKISDGCIALWAEVLRALPEAVLVIKNEGLNFAPARASIIRRFAAKGVEEGRLRLVGHMPHILSHLGAYEEIDIALDTWPYHGTTTTCEALWMGVPVVTLAGNIHVSRVGVSLLANAGLPELIAKTPEEYVAIAVSLAADRERLANLRQGMRERLWKSPLLDMKSFTRRLEDAYRLCWRNYCAAAKSLP